MNAPMLRLSLLFCLSAMASGAFASGASAAVIGTNEPAQAITAARIAALPIAQRVAWQAYLARSQAQRLADRAALAAERKPGLAVPPPPQEDAHSNSMPLDRDAKWYGTPEARHIADVIVSFQTPAGGWGKNQSRAGALRMPGQAYVPDNISHYLSEGDFDTPLDPAWNYVGTLDNGATISELWFLARVSGQTSGADGDAYRASFRRGLRYLFAAQFPNGGWPQVWPLEGGYHDAITYNDDAVTLAAELLTVIGAGGANNYVPKELRDQAAVAARHARDCILATQVAVNGRRTIWGQQHDALTLTPVSARNFEPPALASSESAELLIYLMSLPEPSAELRAAIRAAARWFKAAAITGYAWTGRDTPQGRRLVAQPGAGPLWARFYTADPMRPVFGDRDKTLHDDVGELTLERRNGYNWYVTDPQKALTLYDSWSKAHPAP